MKNIIGLIICCIFIAGCVHFSNVSPVQNDMWVAISFDRGGMNDEISAKLDKSTFNKITSGEVKRGWLEIERAYWIRCGKRIPVISAGVEWGYGNKYIIRIESINRIIPLSDEAIRSIEKSDQSTGQITPPDIAKQCH